MTKYTPEVVEYLKKNSDTPLKIQIEELEEKFGLEITYSALTNIRRKYEIKRSLVFYDTEVLDWIKKNADLKIDKQVELIKNQLGVNVSKKQIISARMHYGIKSSVHFNSIFTKEISDFIKKHKNDYDNKTMVQKINEKFKTSYTSVQIRLFRRRNNLEYRLFCKEALEYMRNHNQDSYEQLQINVNNIFGKNYSLQQVKSACYLYKLREFQKRRERESFTKPGFSERLKKSEAARIEIKINGKWIAKSKYVYETLTGKKVQDDEVVVFLDGDIYNFDLNNLLCVKKKELGVVNRQLNGTCLNNGELTKFKYDVAKLKLQICEKQRQLKERVVKK